MCSRPSTHPCSWQPPAPPALDAGALREYLAREAWQIEDIQKALKDADAGDFATPEEVKAISDKWTANAR
ncbi:CopG family ribbon-helix-helix protein [Pseudomonas sp. Ma2-10]